MKIKSKDMSMPDCYTEMSDSELMLEGGLSEDGKLALIGAGSTAAAAGIGLMAFGNRPNNGNLNGAHNITNYSGLALALTGAAAVVTGVIFSINDRN